MSALPWTAGVDTGYSGLGWSEEGQEEEEEEEGDDAGDGEHGHWLLVQCANVILYAYVSLICGGKRGRIGGYLWEKGAEQSGS